MNTRPIIIEVRMGPAASGWRAIASVVREMEMPMPSAPPRHATPIITPAAMALLDVTSASLNTSCAAASGEDASSLLAARAGTDRARSTNSSANSAANFFMVFMANYLFLQMTALPRAFLTFLIFGFFSCFSVDSP